MFIKLHPHQMEILSKEEQKNIKGGRIAPIGSCTAKCGSKPSVTCEGDECTATDNVGCDTSTETKSCNSI